MGGKSGKQYYTPEEFQSENNDIEFGIETNKPLFEEPLENIGYKGTDRNMKCKGFKFELGEIYECKEKIELCKHGFHLCKNLEDIFQYRDYGESFNRYFIVKYGKEFLEEKDTSCRKICSQKVQLIREIDYKLITKADIGTQYIIDCFSIYVNKKQYTIETTQFFIDQGIDIKTKDNWFLRFACSNGEIEMVKYLVSVGADITAKNNECMINACRAGHLHVVEYLLSQGILFTEKVLQALDIGLKDGRIHKIRYEKFMKEIVYNTKLW
jgi:hypothetical protein